ncbi:putative altered inheritance of mitochondria protein 13, mitochondrial [Rhexocercosporidium sp. MPI-PUGE-AT-0058]|nr:putative altered inheritance of mitochondria protein 13, mitochondrial [Rhexocercosporidium sp. MPI-PUGE-AT-0058]
MGSGSSKPETAPKTQVWTSETPVRFSQGLVDSLQESSETDSTRAKTLELHIQSRVSEELKKLQEKASKDFEELSAKISAAEDSIKNKASSGKSEGDHLRQLGREAVQNDVEGLRKKLEQRKKLADVDEGVERAKSEVVKCLRANDRRPLDCWREVEAFKEEVRRLEGVWVEKIVR